MHKRAHAGAHARSHNRTITGAQARGREPKQAHIHTRTNTRLRARGDTLTHTRIRTQTHLHVHRHPPTHACARAHARTRTQAVGLLRVLGRVPMLRKVCVPPRHSRTGRSDCAVRDSDRPGARDARRGLTVSFPSHSISDVSRTAILYPGVSHASARRGEFRIGLLLIRESRQNTLQGLLPQASQLSKGYEARSRPAARRQTNWSNKTQRTGAAGPALYTHTGANARARTHTHTPQGGLGAGHRAAAGAQRLLHPRPHHLHR